MKPVEIVKINKLIPIFKGEETANAIEVARISTLNGESCEFNIIVQKGLYNINDNVIYIQPDFCLPDNVFFAEYHRPGGDPKKSRLGKNGRIRAIKFNFSFEGMNDPIYSNGVIMPLNIFNIDNIYEVEDLQTELNIIKYVSEDSFENSQNSGLTKGDFPSFMYKTDEERIENLKNHVNRVAESGMEIAATIKRDGSSITIYDRKNPIDDEREFGICTRNQEKKLEQKYISSYKNENGVVLRPHFDRETKTKGWFDDSKDKFYTQDEVDELNFESIEQFVRDSWVDTVKENNYLDKLKEYCDENNVQLVLRGELIGAGNKGSGNKLNSDAKLNKSHIVWFGVDDLSSGRSIRINYSSEHNLNVIGEKLNLDVTKPVFTGVFTYEELIKKSNEFFNYIKETEGRVIEGLVFRSIYDNSLSTKYINPEYDSRS